MGITIDDSYSKEVIRRIRDAFIESQRITRSIASRLRDMLARNVEESRGADGRVYPLVKHVTEAMPIKYGDPHEDRRIRKSVSGNPRAFNVSGGIKNSLKVYPNLKFHDDVGYDDPRTDLIIQSNARSKHNKPKRDPFGVTERQLTSREMDVVEDVIIEEVKKALDGL